MWEFLPNAKYIGEVGLDFVDKTYRSEQLSFFSELIERCRYDNNKILSIHSRKAVREVLSIVGSDFRFKPILHWFTGSVDELTLAVEAGFYFSVNASMMKSKRFLSLLPLIPSDRILLESDSPFIKYDTSYTSLVHLQHSVENEKINIVLWDNFKKILDSLTWLQYNRTLK